MPIAAHRCTLHYIGGSFARTGDAMTLISDTTYGLSGSYKNIVFNPDATTPIVYDNGSPIAGWSADFLAGQVILDDPPLGNVTIDYTYLALNAAIEVREFSLNLTRDELETTLIGDNNKKYLMGLRGGTGTIGGLDVLSTLFINSAGPPAQQFSIQSVHLNETRFVLSVQLDPDTRRTFRAFVKIPSLDLSGARDGLIEGSFPFTISSITATRNLFGKDGYSFFTAVP